jgi:hypothetical protein
VTGDAWPSFLYPHAKCDPEDVEKGLFKSAILLKVQLYPCCSDPLLIIYRLLNSFSHPRHPLRISIPRKTWKNLFFDHRKKAADKEHPPEAMLPILWE